MEQISFEDLYEAADFLKKEQAAFQLLKPALEETLAKDNLAPKSIFFREGSAEKRSEFSRYLGFPADMTAPALLSAVNILYGKEKFAEIYAEFTVK